jgi:short-subunit dehydrogenase
MSELPVYGAVKLALHYVVEDLRAELEERGVRVLAVYPGLVRTEFHRRAGRNVEGGVDPAKVAREVAHAISKGRKRLYVPRYLAMLRLLGPYLPLIKGT